MALFLERGVELAVSILAVLEAGGAWVPVDPAYPPARIAWLLGDCGASLVLTIARSAWPRSNAPITCASPCGFRCTPTRG